METAILAVTLLMLILIAAYAYVIYDLLRSLKAFREAIMRQAEIVRALGDSHSEVRDILIAASKRNAAKESVFDKGAKIPVSGNVRYVPVARRRAQAERESQGPENHTEQVRANNARVLETL